MKKILSLTFISLYFIVQGQEKFRLDDSKQKIVQKINSEVLTTILMVERRLEKNNSKLPEDISDPFISVISQAYKSQGLTEKQINKIESIICTECYNKEWKLQYEIKEKKLLQNQITFDSLQKVKQVAFDEKLRLNLKQAKEEIRKSSASDYDSSKPVNPYTLIKRSLYAFSKTNTDLVVFRKMDYNFPHSFFNAYLQLEMSLAPTVFTDAPNCISQKYIPKVSSQDEYVTVKYNVTRKPNLVGYYDFMEDDVPIISSVEITGTPSLIIELFLNFWPGTIKVEGFKKGDLAFKDLLGDHIVIKGITAQKYQIVISKGNQDVDYEKTYGINKVRK
jgi:hypothetical protein